jgi:hypothetical protein
MEIELTVTHSEYREILMWDDDGGATRNVIYRIVPDPAPITPVTKRKLLKKCNPEQGAAESLAEAETVTA